MTNEGCPIVLENEQPIGFPGPSSEFNYGGGIQGSFPFEGPTYTLEGNKGQPIETLKSDGSVIGSYNHSIIRPFDTIHLKRTTPQGEKCSWPCYSGEKYQSWCNKDNAVNYFAMRPLVTPDTYNGWLTNMFNYLSQPGHEVSKLLNVDLVPKVFCQPTLDNYGDEESVVMKWLMEQIAQAVSNIPQMQNNGPWRREEFHHTDVQFYSFGANGLDSSVYKIIFNLYNALRSTSTLVECVVLNPGNKGNYVVAKMGFVNNGEWKLADEKPNDGLVGYNLPPVGQDYQINLNSANLPIQTEMGWNYGNTLNNQEFNLHGFYEPGYNVPVLGGVPDSLKSQLKQCENSMTMLCETPRYDGINSEGKMVNNNGQPHMVQNNPSIVYKDFPSEKPSNGQYQTVNVFT